MKKPWLFLKLCGKNFARPKPSTPKIAWKECKPTFSLPEYSTMFKKLISEIARSLKSRNIAYMIIGGQAVLLYGEPRLTRDIDITLACGNERLKDILETARSIGLKPLIKNIEEFTSRTMVLPVIEEKTGIRVDFIFSFTPYEKEAVKRAKKITMEGVEVAFASPEDLIIHKIFSGRPRDTEDVKNVLLKNRTDESYIEKRLSEFDASFPEKKFLRTFKKLLKETQ